MELSVVIPSYNAADVIGEQLDALAGETWDAPWEIIVADNGSTDGTHELVTSYAARMANLRLVDASARRGSAYARNHGVANARGANIAFVDADDVIARGWLAAIGNTLRQHAFVASRLEIERLNEPWLVESRPHEQTTGLMRVSYPPRLPHAAGSGLGVRRRLHEEVGGFDESLQRLQDTDYCFRIQLAGTPLHFAGEAVVHMRYRDTMKDMFRQSRHWGEYNVLLAKRYQSKLTARQAARLWYNYCRRWLRLAGRLPRLRQRAELARWMRNCGWLIGIFQGSVRYRVPPF